ncbi:MAG: ComEC/Rec2 family competence protein [Planctomycetaceae bacterium]|nr:ComEC/Rec2 family competence protein [Planctomycetaceae bacterium]
MSHREPLPICLLAMCLGIWLDKITGVSGVVWGTLFLFSALIWWFRNRFLYRRSSARRTVAQLEFAASRNRPAQIAISSLLLIGTAISWSGLWHHWYWNDYAPNDVGLLNLDMPTPVVMEGCVTTSPRWIPAPPYDPGRFMAPTDQTVLTFRATCIRNGVKWENASGFVMLFVSGQLPNVHYGDQLRIVGELSRPNTPKNPGDFDQATNFRQSRILAMLRAGDAESVTLLKHGRFGIGRLLETLRKSGDANIKRYMSPEHAAFASAMVLGIRDEVEPELNQMLAESGVAHIISISGTHVGLIALGMIFVLRTFGLRRKPLAVLLTLAILCYLCITDMRPSAIRSALLVFVVCLSIFRGQRHLQINAFAATGIVVLMLNPTSLFQLGTQLSFLATAVFLWFDKPVDFFQWFVNLFVRRKTFVLSDIERRESELNELAEKESRFIERSLFGNMLVFTYYGFRRFVNMTTGTFLVSVVIWLLVSPLIVSQLHIFSSVAILVNPLLWIPLTLALLSSFALVLIAWICPPLAVPLGVFANFSYGLLTSMIAMFHAIPYSYCWLPGPPVWWLIGLYIPFLFWTMLPKNRPKRYWLVMLPVLWGLVAVGTHQLHRWNDWRNDRMTIRILSVGHGLSVHVRMPDGRSFLYDVGCISSPYKSATIAADSLWDAGNTKINAIMISHPDSDHYNGLPHLLEKFQVKTIDVTPFMFQKENQAIKAVRDTIEKHQIPVRELVRGDSLASGGVQAITVLHPPPVSDMQAAAAKVETNPNSMVVMIEHRGHRVLLPGDLDIEDQIPFLHDTPVHVDLVVAPHHGSVKKTADDIVAWATPDFLVISGGLFTYKPQTKTHFEQAGCKVFNTLHDGMIEITIDRNGFRVQPFVARSLKNEK